MNYIRELLYKCVKKIKLFYGASEIMPKILQKVYMAGICASWTRASERIFRANQQKVISAGVTVDICRNNGSKEEKDIASKLNSKLIVRTQGAKR